MTLRYLREQIISAEGDVRRRAGVLIGRIIANYQEHYRKELPDSVSREDGIDVSTPSFSRDPFPRCILTL